MKIPCGHTTPQNECHFCWLATTEQKYKDKFGTPWPLKPRGLGDTVERALGAFGRWFKRRFKSCGCGKRRDALNKIVPYN